MYELYISYLKGVGYVGGEVGGGVEKHFVLIMKFLTPNAILKLCTSNTYESKFTPCKSISPFLFLLEDIKFGMCCDTVLNKVQRSSEYILQSCK